MAPRNLIAKSSRTGEVAIGEEKVNARVGGGTNVCNDMGYTLFKLKQNRSILS